MSRCVQRCTCSVAIKSTVPLPWQYTSPEQVTEQAPSGCYVSGLYLEGARWDLKNNCLQRSHPKVLIEELPILRIIPIEVHGLKLVVRECHWDGVGGIMIYHIQAACDAFYVLYKCFVTHTTPRVTVPPQNTFRTLVYTTSDRRNAMGSGLVFEADLATYKECASYLTPRTLIFCCAHFCPLISVCAVFH